MSSKINPSLQKKTAARMAAVQCLYEQAMTGNKSPSLQVASLKERLTNNKSEQRLLVGMQLEPNYPMLEALLSGIAERMEEINMRLDGTLSAEWKRERMSHLLVALLQCAIYEMFFHKEISPKIVINEYTKLARSFFSDSEVNFVHAALSTLADAYG